MRFVIALFGLMLACVSANAHELTPTYPELRPSIYSDVLVTDMLLFNQRADVSYYQIEVYDEDWNPVPFASASNILELGYLERTSFFVYIREIDADKVEYICTRSKILKGEESSVIASNICSRVK